MALVTFILNDAGIASMANLVPKVSLIPDGPAVLPTNPTDYLVSSKPILAEAGTDGATYTVDLFPSSWTQPRTQYRLVVEWLDFAGNFISRDAPPWRIVVPPEGGKLSDMIDAPLDGSFTWVTTDPGIPPNAQPGDVLFDPDTDDFFQLN